MKHKKEALKSILSIPKRIFDSIRNSYFRSLRGEENFWVVLFGWGVFFYTLATIIVVFLLTDRSILSLLFGFWPLTILMMILIGLPSALLIFNYPFILLTSLLRSSKKRIYSLSSIILFFCFLPLHCIIAYNLLMMLLVITNALLFKDKISAISGLILIFISLIYTLLKIVKISPIKQK